MKYICGKNNVYEALKSKRYISKVYLNRDKKYPKSFIQLVREKKSVLEFKDNAFLNNIDSNNQGYIALASQIKDYELEDIYSDDKVLILDKISDEINFGSIVRTAVSFNIRSIIIPKRNSVNVTEVVEKTSAGAINHAKIVRVTNLNQAVKKLKEKGFWIYATSLSAKSDINDIKFHEKSVIIIGSEGKGVSESLIKNSDYKFKIEAKGFESLNVGVATGIIIYNLIRR